MVHLGITYAAENVLTDSVEDVSGAAMELPNSVAPYWSLEGVDGQEAWSPCTPSSCVCGESLMGLCTWAECKWDTPPIDCLNDAPEGVQWKWNEAGFYQAMRPPNYWWVEGKKGPEVAFVLGNAIKIRVYQLL